MKIYVNQALISLLGGKLAFFAFLFVLADVFQEGCFFLGGGEIFSSLQEFLFSFYEILLNRTVKTATQLMKFLWVSHEASDYCCGSVCLFIGNDIHLFIVDSIISLSDHFTTSIAHWVSVVFQSSSVPFLICFIFMLLLIAHILVLASGFFRPLMSGVVQVAFQTGDYKQQVIFIGGLGDGFMATEYVQLFG